MKLTNLLTVAAFCAAGTACTTKQAQSIGIRAENMDTTAMPGTSFFQYANGGWVKNHPLTDEYSSYGSFNVLADNNNKQLKELVEELAARTDLEAGSVARKVADLYQLAMDSVKLNKDGLNPIVGDLAALSAVTEAKAIPSAVVELYKKGASPYFSLFVGADEKNSSMNIAQLYQGGFSMGERDYYLGEDEPTRKIREAYKQYIAQLFQLAGYNEPEALQAMQVVMDIETRLAKASRSRVELRDPNANYNKISIDQLKKDYAGIDWDAFLREAGLSQIKEINVCQPEAIREAIKVMGEVPVKDQVTYLQYKLIDAASSYLSDNFVAAGFEFYNKAMSGQQQQKPRWKRAVAVLDGALGEGLGQMYVEKYFPAAAKERMVALVKNLQGALGERIKALEWMSEETKAKALEKLAAFHVKIGYPDRWKDYSGLNIENDSYWANIKRTCRWDFGRMIAKAGKPVDKDEWLMTPQTVNAYYNPTTNEICFPAGILQYPFFDMNADDAFNYGAIGVVIGHEMTHGFDDQGRQYDKDGNLKDWWTAADAEKFEARAKVMADFFDSLYVAPGVHANGRLTLGENIADHGGLQVAFQAFKKATAQAPLETVDGLTPEQRFFLSYAGVWAENMRDEEVLRRTKLDPHALARWRVDGALPHIAPWYEAFGITEKDPLFIPVEKRVSIW